MKSICATVPNKYPGQLSCVPLLLTEPRVSSRRWTSNSRSLPPRFVVIPSLPRDSTLLDCLRKHLIEAPFPLSTILPWRISYRSVVLWGWGFLSREHRVRFDLSDLKLDPYGANLAFGILESPRIKPDSRPRANCSLTCWTRETRRMLPLRRTGRILRILFSSKPRRTRSFPRNLLSSVCGSGNQRKGRTDRTHEPEWGIPRWLDGIEDARWGGKIHMSSFDGGTIHFRVLGLYCPSL